VPDALTIAGRGTARSSSCFYASGLRLSELVGLDLDDRELCRDASRACAARAGRNGSCRSIAARPKR
jgi:site-specific recombinase XerC